MTKSRVAVLGTLGEMHRESSAFDLRTLTEIVRDAEPDLLCGEIHPEDWRAGDLRALPPEYGEALIPLSRRTDIVLVPVAGPGTVDLVTPRGGRLLGPRRLVVSILNAHLRWMQSGKRGVRTLNSGAWGSVCHRLCRLTARLCGPEALRAWDEGNETLFSNVVAAIRRDPGRRVLVTVDCRRRHRLEERLQAEPGVELVGFDQL